MFSASPRVHKNGWLEEEHKIPEFTTNTKNSNIYAQPCVDLRHVAKAHAGLASFPGLGTRLMPGVLFLVWFNNFDWLWASIGVARSYSSCPFLCATPKPPPKPLWPLHCDISPSTPPWRRIVCEYVTNLPGYLLVECGAIAVVYYMN